MKQQARQGAADPMRTAKAEFLPFARPSITHREKDAVLQVLDSGWLTTGPTTKAFEEAFSRYVGSAYAIAVNSATAALHLALDALGVSDEDEVIVPTWTFAASAEVVVYRRARPVLVDIEQRTLNAPISAIDAAITSRTKAVIAVHFAGHPLELPALRDHLAAKSIALIEDAAHSFPSRVDERENAYAGTFGRAGAYSFYATKTITTGEGGMLVTDDAAMADRARLMSLHGISKDAWKRYTAAGSWYYEIEDAGYKYNMTDMAAALGLVQLERAEELLSERRRLAKRYSTALAESPVADLVSLPAGMDDASHAWHLYVLRLNVDALTASRGSVIDQLNQRGIGTSVHFIPLHLHPYHRRTWVTDSTAYPVATAEYERVISLPLWPGMGDAGVDRVVDALVDTLSSARR